MCKQGVNDRELTDSEQKRKQQISFHFLSVPISRGKGHTGITEGTTGTRGDRGQVHCGGAGASLRSSSGRGGGGAACGGGGDAGRRRVVEVLDEQSQPALHGIFGLDRRRKGLVLQGVGKTLAQSFPRSIINQIRGFKKRWQEKKNTHITTSDAQTDEDNI